MLKRMMLMSPSLLLFSSIGIVASAASTSTVALPDCVGKPQVRPTEVMIACGDGNVVARKLRWTGWGEPFAAAKGTLSVNDCEPYCAAGHFHNYPVIVVASGKQRCPNGTRAYRTFTYAYIGKGPDRGDPNVDFPCKPR